MKIFKIIISVIIPILYSSCELEEPVYDLAAPKSSIKTLDDVDVAMYGIYAHLGSNNGGFGRDALWSTHFFADDLSSTVPWQAGQWGRKTDVNAGNNNVNTIWINFYSAINNANSIPGYVGLADVSNEEGRADRLIAESKFLRGFLYFHLVQWYGGVPLVTQPSDGSQDFYIPRNTVDEVYKVILKDFKEAAPFLHTRSSQPTDEFYRATKGAAYGYLAKANLTYANYLYLDGRAGEAQQYYEQAISAADNVISSGQYNLLSDYSKLYNVEQERAAYEEVIFGIAHTRDAAEPGPVGEGTQKPVHFCPVSFPNTTSLGANRGGNGFFKIQPWFFERYNSGDYVGDYRVESTFLTTWQNAEGVIYFAYPLTSNDPGAVSIRQTFLKKYTDANGISTWGHENDLFLLRLSEIYLIKAEAENELHGPTAKALKAFNRLRERARLADGTPRTTPVDLQQGLTKEELRMKIFDERGLEFVGEFHRYFDLIRMIAPDNQSTMYQYQFQTFLPSLEGGLPSFNKVSGTWSGGVILKANVVPYDAKYLHFPLPDNQLSINANLKQNPGW